MNTLVLEFEIPTAVSVEISDDTIAVDLSDGRSIFVPVGWFPRLEHATSQEREHWRLVGNGQGINWRDIDEDISVEGLILGKPSGESQDSFRNWLQDRKRHTTTTNTPQ